MRADVHRGAWRTARSAQGSSGEGPHAEPPGGHGGVVGLVSVLLRSHTHTHAGSSTPQMNWPLTGQTKESYCSRE